ncbi:MAG: LysR family transcriptional regulator [Pseudomonadota bacterium]
MQDLNWSDLKFALALHRAGALTSAARALGVNETTVARRVKALDRSVGAALFRKGAAGGYALTETGRAVLRHAERIEAEALEISRLSQTGEGEVQGVVRVTSPPVIVNRVLTPNLPSLRADHPKVTVELIPEPRDLSLTKRESDLAVRLARPTAGGLDVIGRRLGELSYRVYGKADLSDKAASDLDWIAYDGAHLHLPQAKWLAAAARRDGPDAPALRVADAETAIEAVAAGLGKSLLPAIAADVDDRLRAIESAQLAPPPEREVWLLSHRSDADVRAFRAVAKWIAGVDWKSGTARIAASS